MVQCDQVFNSVLVLLKVAHDGLVLNRCPHTFALLGFQVLEGRIRRWVLAFSRDRLRVVQFVDEVLD